MSRALALANQCGAETWPDVAAYFDELWDVCANYKLNPDALAAQSAFHTNGWTNQEWNEFRNPAGLRHQRQLLRFESPRDAARAHVARAVSALRGWDGATRVIRLLPYDPGWHQAASNAKYTDLCDVWKHWGVSEDYRWRLEFWYDRLANAIRFGLEENAKPLVEGAAAMRSGNIWSPRMAAKPVIVVHHVTGYPDHVSCGDRYMDPGSKTSVHFMVDRDGKVYQFVATINASWSLGEPENSVQDNAVLAELLRLGQPLDHFAVNIAVTGGPHDLPTHAQQEGVARICRALQEKYDIPCTREYHLLHSEIEGSQYWCPGPKYGLEGILDLAAQGPDQIDLRFLKKR
jgi:N-acetyl-anhydromuramyl-L-alanine amidase AmpD